MVVCLIWGSGTLARLQDACPFGGSHIKPQNHHTLCMPPKLRQLQNQSPQPLLVKCAIAERLRREQKTLSIVVATTCSHACSETINQTLKKENCYRLMMTMASFLPLFTLLKINDPIEYWQIDILLEQQTILHLKALNIALAHSDKKGEGQGIIILIESIFFMVS
jgi:hypothetical protein